MNRLDRWLFSEIPAERLAAVRILVGAFAWIYLTARSPDFFDLATRTPGRFDGVGIVAAWSEPWTAQGVLTSYAACWLLAGAFTLGLWFRFLAPAFALGLTLLLTYRNSFGMVFHTENLLVLHVWILAFAPCATRWAYAPRSPKAKRRPALAWPLRLMALVCVSTYMLAGIAKLANSGSGWLSGEVLMGHIAYDALRKSQVGGSFSPLGPWLLRVPWIFGPLAWLSVLWEIGAPLALIRERWGHAWVAGAWCFHFGVWVLMFIFFPYPLTGIAFLAFFKPDEWMNRLVSKS